MDSQYQLKLESREKGRVYEFETADGLKSKNSFREEELLLVDQFEVDGSDSVLIIQSNYGLLGVVLGEDSEKVTMQDTSARACVFSRLNAGKNSLGTFEVRNTRVENLSQSFDQIVYAPADYEPVDLVKQRLSVASGKLSEDGEVHLAGRKKSGLKRYRKFLGESGQIERTGKRGSVKSYCFQPDSVVPKQDLENEFTAEVNGLEADFRTSEGLFSPAKLDQGTRILLENIELDDPESVLDLGCGYGAISVFLAQSCNASFFLTDDSVRATDCAERNMRENGLDDFDVRTGDCLDAFQDRSFDTVVSNPPTHQGKGVTDKMFRQAHEVLRQGGEFWLVYNQNMSYETKLEEIFGSVEIVTREQNFHVVRARK